MTEAAFYTSAAWRRKRAAWLRLHPICVVMPCGKRATEVDHIVALSRGGMDAPSNYQSMCASHHGEKTRRDQRGGDDPQYVDGVRGERVIRIVGAPASGKSTLRRKLTAALGIPGFDVHEERVRLMAPGEQWPKQPERAWEALDRGIRANPGGSVVETGGNTRHEERLYERRETLTVVCVVSQTLRRARLEARAVKGGPHIGDPRRYVEALSSMTTPIVAGALVYVGDDASLIAKAGAFLAGGVHKNEVAPGYSGPVRLSYPNDAPSDLYAPQLPVTRG